MTGVVEEDFVRLTDPYRRELLAHCYRMLGSVHDAEDLVQETYLRAWRAYDDFEGRSSMRTWLYRIATNTALNALESRKRRPLPTGLGGPSDSPEGDLAERQEVTWLEPYPDSMISPADPANVVAEKESVRLAFVAALQHLPPKQRVVLLLREVLKWKAAEVAELLGTTTAAVNSSLQRARAQLDDVAPSLEEAAEPEPTEAQKREMLQRWVQAFEAYDVQAIKALMTDDIVWEMPPFAAWFKGVTNVGRLISFACPAEGPGDQVMVPVESNGQPGFALYMRDKKTKQHHAFQIQVLTLTAAGVAHATVFFDLSLFDAFGLPQLLSDLADSQPPQLAAPTASVHRRH